MESGQDLQNSYCSVIENFKQTCVNWGWKEDCSEWPNFSEGTAIFNTDLESVDIKGIEYIVVADNPGKNERDKAR